MAVAPPRPPDSTTWTGRVTQHLAQDPHGAALVSVGPDGARTYPREELTRMTAGALELLDEVGAPPGAAVPALLTTRPTSIALLLAGALSGRPLAPLGPRLTPRELLACVEGLAGPVLLTEPEWKKVAEEVARSAGKRVVAIEGSASANRPLPTVEDPEAVAFVLHTSGTTGRPRPVLVRQAPLRHRTDVIGDLLQLGRGDRLAAASLFHHVGGLGNIAACLAGGATLTAFAGFSVQAWRDVGEVGPTHAVLVPSLIEILLAADALALPTLRVVAYGGSPIHPATMRRLQRLMPQVDLVNLFGQTEGSPLTVLGPADHRAAAEGHDELLSSVGRAVPGVELHLHDVDDEGVGEVWARSAHGFVVDEQGWQHTGDLGRLSDGYLYLVGRLGDRIIRGGENVFPLEVEQVLEAHESVLEAAVVGVPDRRLGEALKAYLVPARPEAPPDLALLRAFVRERLAGFKVPTDWEVVASLPRNHVGKLLRRQLASRHGADDGRMG